MTRFAVIIEKLEDCLEAEQSKIETNVSQCTIDFLTTVAYTEFNTIESNVKKLQTAISEVTHSSTMLVSKSVFKEEIEQKPYIEPYD